jgi:nucleotide-binding universal stress UspA family protein
MERGGARGAGKARDVVRHVLIPDDGSDPAWRAVEVGTDIAFRYQAHATVLTGIHTPAKAPVTIADVQEEDREERAFAEKVQQSALAYAEARGLDLNAIVLAGHPVEAIVDYARHHAVDLIVMGHRGQSNLARFFGGSVSDRVVDHAHCMVLIVR